MLSNSHRIFSLSIGFRSTTPIISLIIVVNYDNGDLDKYKWEG